jgi:hypothetical protein
MNKVKQFLYELFFGKPCTGCFFYHEEVHKGEMLHICKRLPLWDFDQTKCEFYRTEDPHWRIATRGIYLVYENFYDKETK